MSSPVFNVQNLAKRSRASVFFRGWLSFPHVVIAAFWAIGIAFLTFFQWWIIIFTGGRNESIWNSQNRFLGYITRVKAYRSLLFDKWPAFGSVPQGEPTGYDFVFEKKAKRMSTFFRGFLAIPAYFVLFFLSIGSSFAVLFSWFAILFTAKHPQGLFDFTLKVRRYSLKLAVYTKYMSDDFPKTN